VNVKPYLPLLAREIYSDMARNISNVYGKEVRLVVTRTLSTPVTVPRDYPLFIESIKRDRFVYVAPFIP